MAKTDKTSIAALALKKGVGQGSYKHVANTPGRWVSPWRQSITTRVVVGADGNKHTQYGTKAITLPQGGHWRNFWAAR